MLRLLDAFGCQGGAGFGYNMAGFGVVGLDRDDQPRYPQSETVSFVQMDFLDVTPEFLSQFDAIHASPPCQAHSRASNGSIRSPFRPRPDLIDETRDILEEWGGPWIIENVEGAPLRSPAKICGSAFPELRVRRHRLFETNWPLHGTVCRHADQPDFITVAGHFSEPTEVARIAMGMPWATKHGLTQAVPPAFTKWVGTQLKALLDDV